MILSFVVFALILFEDVVWVKWYVLLVISTCRHLIGFGFQQVRVVLNSKSFANILVAHIEIAEKKYRISFSKERVCSETIHSVGVTENAFVSGLLFKGCLYTSKVHFTPKSYSIVGVSTSLVFRTQFCGRNRSLFFLTLNSTNIFKLCDTL